MKRLVCAAVVLLAQIPTQLFAEPMGPTWTGSHGPCIQAIYLMDQTRQRADYSKDHATGVRTVRIDPKAGDISTTETSPDGNTVPVTDVGAMVIVDPSSPNTFRFQVVLENGSGKRRIQVIEQHRLNGWKSIPDGDGGLTATEMGSLIWQELADDQCPPPDN